MNIYLISEYVNRMQKQDVNNFAIKQGITLDNEELDIIYNYIKNNFVLVICLIIMITLPITLRQILFYLFNVRLINKCSSKTK